MNAMDIFVGPALQEGFGLVAVEAQAASTPCILYKGFPETVDMRLGLVTFMDSFDIQNWVNAIREIKLKNIDKDLVKNKIQTLGFDSRMNAKEISNLYLKMSKSTLI
jgi:glycosyltransferase EpsF